MKNLSKKIERHLSKIVPQNKKGQIVSTISGTTLSIMVLIFIIFAVLFGIATLNPAGFFTANSAEANATGYLTGNLTDGVSQFGAQIPNVFKILAVVLVLGGIVLLVLYIRRMQAVGGGGNAGL